jgi:beta-galactosidase GanA
MMYYGAQYYRPPFPERNCWERDFKNMRELGFTCVKLWAVWNWIEPKQGKFHFDDLDKLTELAAENHLKVIINIIPEGAPYWTDTRNKDDLYQTADGQIITYGGPANLPTAGWPGRCIDDDDFAALVSRFIETTARHFASNRTIAAIDVWNEPHLEPMYDYRQNMLCYCPHSKARFRAWLQIKYETLKKLNMAWKRTYQNWEEVTPPTRFGTTLDMLDWRKFWLWNMRRWLDIRVNACKKGAPNIPVQTHVAYSGYLGNKITGGLGNELGDEFDLARGVDIFGLSSFPLWLMGEEHVYRHFLHCSMIAEAAKGKKFYQVELQGGAGKPGLLGSEVPTESDIKLWNWNIIASGGKGSVYWQYAPEPAGLESPGFGLTGFSGENTPRSKAAGICAKKFSLMNDLSDAAPAAIMNAIYVSRSSDLICFSAGRQEKLYAESLSGVFQALYRKSVPVRFFHQDYIDELSSSGIKALYLPMALVLSRHETEVLYRFVNEGGILISEACPGLYQENGILDQKCQALKKLFGLKHIEIEASHDWGDINVNWTNSNLSFTGRLYRQTVKPGSNVSILATFDDGSPAVTEYSCGKGRAIWIGTFVSDSYEISRKNETAEAITRWFYPQGYAMIRHMSITHLMPDVVPVSPVVRLLENKAHRMLVAVNPTKNPVSVSIEFKKEQNLAELSSDGYTLRLIIQPLDGKVLTWNK